MLQPTRTKTARAGFLHTHLVRGGSLMLQPTAMPLAPHRVLDALAKVQFKS